MARNARPKPLHGAKKQDRAFLSCTVEDCEEEFYVSRASRYTLDPAERFCRKHFALIAAVKAAVADGARKRDTLIEHLTACGIL
jgi:hypothetical protein